VISFCSSHLPGQKALGAATGCPGRAPASGMELAGLADNAGMGGGLVGRGPERAGLSEFLEAGAGVGLVWGEAGIGKSVLLGWLADQAARSGWLVLRAAPAEAERGLPFAGLADLLGPHLSGVRDALPGPLARALDAALLQADAPAGGRGDLAVRLGVLEALRGTVALCHPGQLRSMIPMLCRSDGDCQVVEGDAEPLAGEEVGGDVVVAAAKVLHEGMSGGEDPR
jgi:AAA ATPase domain